MTDSDSITMTVRVGGDGGTGDLEMGDGSCTTISSRDRY